MILSWDINHCSKALCFATWWSATNGALKIWVIALFLFHEIAKFTIAFLEWVKDVHPSAARSLSYYISFGLVWGSTFLDIGTDIHDIGRHLEFPISIVIFISINIYLDIYSIFRYLNRSPIFFNYHIRYQC